MNRILRHLVCLSAFLLPLQSGEALGPHEILLLVNSNSPRSKQIANHYARLRQVPPRNIVYLSLPDSVLKAAAEISPDDFTRFIWNPANEIAKQRKIDDHVLAWIYSIDFPIRVATDPVMSIQGLTFTRNNIPPAEVIQKGTYQSPLFAGPDAADHPGAPAHSLERFCERYRTQMPLPSMMLGWMGSRGLDEESMLKLLNHGALADRTAPNGTVYFFMTDDVRSRCRDWQYPAAQQELAGLHVASIITSNFPIRGAGVLGLMCGTQVIDPAAMPSFLPGSMADTLTSYAGVMESSDHTKLTEWLRAGATGSSGPVTEPYAVWTKFPNARFYCHYASGCTLIESFYQSIRCPLQLIIAGEPFATPWAAKLSMVLVCADEGADTGKAEFHAEIFPIKPNPKPDFLYLLDGRVINRPSSDDMDLDLTGLSDGYHEVRVVAYLQGLVRRQVFAATGFNMKRRGRAARFDGLKEMARVDLFHPLRVKVTATEQPSKLGIACGERVLVEAVAQNAAVLEIDPKVIGAGPNNLQAVAVYDDGEVVRGSPVSVNISQLNRPPVISAVHFTTNEQKQLVLSPEIFDPEGDAVRVDWFESVTGRIETSAGQVETNAGVFIFTPSMNAVDTAIFPKSSLAGVTELTVRVSVSVDPPNIRRQQAGIIFDFKDRHNYSFACLRGDYSAWAVGACRAGVTSLDVTRGAYLLPDREYLLSIRRAGEHGIEFTVDGNLLIGTTDENLGSGLFGFLVGVETARFKDFAISPPPDTVCAQGGAIALSPEKAKGLTLTLRVSDGHAFASRSIMLP